VLVTWPRSAHVLNFVFFSREVDHATMKRGWSFSEVGQFKVASGRVRGRDGCRSGVHVMIEWTMWWWDARKERSCRIAG